MHVADRTDQTHELEAVTEDLELLGGSAIRSWCSCGWSSRPAAAHGVAVGLWRRHIVLAGRGQPRMR